MIKDIMSKNVIVVDINTELNEVCNIMKKYDVGFLPISEKNKIIGVLTDRDIVVKILANNDHKLKGYITNDIIKVNENDDLNKALELMTKHKVKRLLVENDNKLVGIISLSDILNKKDDCLDNIRQIFEINRNTDTYITKINEFYL